MTGRPLSGILRIGSIRFPDRGVTNAPGSAGIAIGMVAFLAALMLSALVPGVALSANGVDTDNPIPVMAYYYIWYDEPSWNRAKTDYPILGRYSSDDRSVMEQHIRWAKDAGIDGFIVSWKSTFKLDRRLEQLISVARDEDFHLWIIYQGLDFERDPLPIEHVEADFEYFMKQYADESVFTLVDRPVVILSGTWEFSAEEIAQLTAPYGESLYILASERNIEGYNRVADSVDGNAYYWSSVNPNTFPGYEEKLLAFSSAVHKDGGLWIAPAAPGFDARLVGGTSVVGRAGGQTLRQEMDTALKSAPDAIGLISWNEFSENSHIEPSLNHGSRYLDIVADIESGTPPQLLDFDSDAPAFTRRNDFHSIYVLAGMSMFMIGSIVVVMRRRNAFEQNR